ncbi:aromatic-ring-hydroxylating dioxygenase subunit beta [Henriciella mobilis]|uniref:Benzene 1,2-dioxygenase n=1 Tax=Henriciella mobilis TaxID=2305467 RepID=A0A399RA51_9PROT|nr:aromatic-ring-hydroxylating dioxygenase subunit beta [Henriciella mobilis]RIJ26837.1 benzene 1,2-dioxygenase [Henriciella mobilis]
MSVMTERPQEESLYQKAQRILSLEGYLLDVKRWDDWLDLYAKDAEYWVPAWKDDLSVTEDPARELSLIYYPNRTGLEDRVFRIKSGKSLASTPLPRTCHMMNIARVARRDDGLVEADCSWSVYSYRFEKAAHLFGLSNYLLKETETGFQIKKRRTLVHSDTIPNVLDIYSI